MKQNDDLKFYIEKTEEAIKNFNHLKSKSSILHDQVSNSMEEKKARFEEKRKLKNKEFNFLRNK